MTKTQRIRSDESNMLEKKVLELIHEKNKPFKESELIHTLIRKHINDLTADEVIEYRKKYLKK